MVPSQDQPPEPMGIQPRDIQTRNRIERLFRRLKGYRRIFSRFDKLDIMFLAFITFALIPDTYKA